MASAGQDRGAATVQAPAAPAHPGELAPAATPRASAAPDPLEHEPRRSRARAAKRIAGWGVSILALAAVVVVYLRWVRPEPVPFGLIVATGRVEGDETLIAGRRAGRIRELLVSEGDSVRAGQLLARLDDGELSARLEQARAQVARATGMLGEADATVARAEAAERQAAADAARFTDLASRGTVPRVQGEHARLAWTTAERDLAAARALRTQASAAIAQARGARAEAESALDDQTIVAPGPGTVTTRIRSAGEVVAAGAPLLAIVDLDHLYLQVYVAETELGKLRLGLPARVYTDAFPDRPFAATVGWIASQAEFTPKEVQTTDERVKLVFAVKLYLDENPGHALTPGMPADAVIRWRAEAPWAKPRR